MTEEEKDAIERLKKERNNLNRQAQKYFEKCVRKDKMIELMAKYIGEIDVSETLCMKKSCEEGNCVDCIKMYFEKKVEEK